MTMMDTIRARHSVRDYLDKPIEGETLAALQAAVAECAQASGLNIQLVQDNPEVYDMLGSLGIIHGDPAYLAFIVPRGKAHDEAIGYWGQLLVLQAQELGLNTCWVAFCSRKKSTVARSVSEELRIIVTIGYGKTPGHSRNTKSAETLLTAECPEAPAWLATAVEAAQLAPTAVNNQNFHITLEADGRTVRIVPTSTKGWNVVDVGIVKRNFEEAANEAGADWRWAE